MKLHTPGPYVLWDDGRTIGIESADVDEKGETFPISVWEVVDYGDQADPEQLRGDQEFAFRAITSHYQMLAALDETLRCNLPQHIKGQVLAAIAAAKGQ